MTRSRIITGGSWDADDWPVYFLAGYAMRSVNNRAITRSRLFAMNELAGEPVRQVARGLIQRGVRLFIDSGVFDLAQRTAAERNCTFAEASALPASQVPGFDALRDLYITVLQEFGDVCWGYIELDQGAPDEREARRAELRALGLSPIPVYRPLTDPLDEFVSLLTRYDRVAVGGIVAIPARPKRRLLMSLAEVVRDYPDTWVHLLGYIPLPPIAHLPFRSCDAAWWKHLAMFAALQPRAALAPIGRLATAALPARGRDSEESGSHAFADLAAALSESSAERNWATLLRTPVHAP